MRVLLLMATTLLFLFSNVAAFAGECTKAEAKIYKVLFQVGGWAGHDPVNLPKMLKGVLEGTGRFYITITEDGDQFKPENIKNYDLVLIYTTGRELSPEQEKGLTEFVKNGGGLVGIHSATDSFKNSDEYWKMLGGRFTGHGHGKFLVRITGKSHIIVEGMDNFEVTDETYQHAFHPDSKLVTLMRRESDGAPVSWVHYYGNGRVFVTGLGHDVNSWSHKSFQEMIIRALLWSAGELNP